jgi:hypothetical protein
MHKLMKKPFEMHSERQQPSWKLATTKVDPVKMMEVFIRSPYDLGENKGIVDSLVAAYLTTN